MKPAKSRRLTTYFTGQRSPNHDSRFATCDLSKRLGCSLLNRWFRRPAIGGIIILTLLSYGLYVVLAADQFFAGDGSLFTASKWAATAGGPFTSAFTAGNVANFASVNGTGAGGSITVGGFTATENFTLTAVSGTLSNTGNGVVPISVASGKTLDFSTQTFTSSATAGYNFTGPGVLALAGNTYGGGFTINSGTLVARGVNAMGGTASNLLTINGGTITGSATRDFTAKFGGGITVGGNFQFGALASAVAISSDTANLTFSNNVALGAATRTITIGANGNYTLGGIISGSAGSGLTIAKLAGTTGKIILTGANNYTGDTTINSGILALSLGGSIASSPNIIVAGSATFDVSGLTTAFTTGTQTLKASGNGTTGTIATTTGKGLSLTSTASLQFTAYNGSTAPLTVTGQGSIGLASTNIAVVTVPGPSLGAGIYKLIAIGSGNTAAVTGTAPSTVTVNGAGGLAAGSSASLVISGGELFLQVVNTPLKYRSKANGNWNSTATWETSPDGTTWTAAASTPTAATADTILITNDNVVSISADVDADQVTVDSGDTNLLINSGVTFTVADGSGTDLTVNGALVVAGTVTNIGQIQINDVMLINQGGNPGGGSGTYAYDQTAGRLAFGNTSGPFAVNNVNYWPTTNGPQNVIVQGGGGITMNVARTIGSSLFLSSGAVSNAGNITLGNAATITRVTGTLAAAPVFGTTVNVIYSGTTAVTTGNELPVSTAVLNNLTVGSSRVDLQACKLEYSIVSPK